MRDPTSTSPVSAKRIGAPAARRTRSNAIDLAIRSGEFLAIVGPSGCGKSTLLRIVAGLVRAEPGRRARRRRACRRPQTNLGIVFQSPVLLDWRTALDNVLVQVELRSLDPEAYRDNALRLLDQIGLEGFRRSLSARAVGRHAPARGDRARADPRSRRCC